MAFKYMRDLMLRSRFTCRIHRTKDEKKNQVFPDLTDIFDIGITQTKCVICWWF